MRFDPSTPGLARSLAIGPVVTQLVKGKRSTTLSAGPVNRDRTDLQSGGRTPLTIDVVSLLPALTPDQRSTCALDQRAKIDLVPLVKANVPDQASDLRPDGGI